MPRIANLLCCGLALFLSHVCHSDAVAQNQTATSVSIDLAPIKESIKKAGKLLKDGKILESADEVEQSTKWIQELTQNASVKEIVEIKKIHVDLAKAHQLLSVEGAELTELPPWDALLKAKKLNRPKKEDEKKPIPQPASQPAEKKNPAKTEPIKVIAPTGKETVSFARDIAPILIAKCNGCHYAATQVSGGLQFNTFTQVVKGGDTGPDVLPGKPDESLIVRKLRGLEGARMPMGRPALPDSQIQLVATWIKEGAAFDGQNKDARLEQVVGQAFADKASHTELMAKRVERAREKWKIASPKTEADEARDEQFYVIGNIGSESAKVLLAQANHAANQVRRMFKISGKESLIKGGITIFALKQRYDYSEFGKMIERRELPPEWSSHWRSEILDSYVAFVFDKAENKINETSLLQQLTSLWMSSHEGVPRWFADGAGRQALAVTVGANDARVQPWLKRLPDSIAQLKSLKSLSDGSMNDEASATIGFGVIRTMYEAKMKTQYDTIVRSLASGMNFEQATTKAIGSMDTFLKKLLGKTK